MKLLKMIEAHSTRLFRVALAGALVTVFAVIGLATAAWTKHNRASAIAASSPVRIQNPSAQARLETEHVTLRSTGFEPDEFMRAAGRFLLAIDNRAEAGELTFRLLRENGSLERELPAGQDKFRLRQVVEIAAGRYSLVAVNHPEWVCRISIQ